MLLHYVVLQYPMTMPTDGKFGSNEEHYNQYSAGAFVRQDRASGGYPSPTRLIQEAEWFDNRSEAERYAGRELPYFNILSLRVEVGLCFPR